MKLSGMLTSIKSMSKSRLLTGAVGLAGLGIIAYDAHNVGKIQADTYASERDAKNTAYYLNNDMYLTSMSRSQEKVRNLAYQMEMDQGWKRFINTPIGYVKGFCTMLVSHVVPLGLSLGALFAPGKASKICAGGLGIYSAYEFIKSFFGLGTPGSIIK